MAGYTNYFSFAMFWTNGDGAVISSLTGAGSSFSLDVVAWSFTLIGWKVECYSSSSTWVSSWIETGLTILFGTPTRIWTSFPTVKLIIFQCVDKNDLIILILIITNLIYFLLKMLELLILSKLLKSYNILDMLKNLDKG